MLPTFSRRDFLKASGAGLLGVFLADLRFDRLLAAVAPKQGRSTVSGIELFDEPSFKAKRIRAFGRDEVMDIRGEVQGDHGYGNPFNSSWYQINEAGFVYSGAVAAHNMRVISPNELHPLSAEVPEEKKRIYVDLATQTVTAFEGENPVLVSRCSSGAKGTETPLGEFRTYHKGPSVHMTNQGDGTDNTHHLPGVPWVSFFTGTGVAFHGTYWHNDYGRPSSRGCVNLSPNDATFIYRWTRPEEPFGTAYLNEPGAGTLVQVIL